MRTAYVTLGMTAAIAIGALTACSGGNDGSSAPPAEPTSTSTLVAAPPTDCGEDLPEGSLLLTASDVRGVQGGRTVSTASTSRLDRARCGVAGDTAIPADDCSPSRFPWTTSAGVANVELYRRGVDEVGTAVFERNHRSSLREVVLTSYAGSKVVDLYRKHVEACGARVMSKVNGQSQLLALGGRGGMLVSVEAGRVICFVALDGRTPTKLLPLVYKAHSDETGAVMGQRTQALE